MVDEGALLRALEGVLSTEAARPLAGDLIVMDRGLRRRSSLYFVGARGNAPVAQWVVKCPTTDVERLGIRPPMSAAEQFRALERLYAFLAEGEGRFASPRPVAFLPEFDAFAMEFAEGHSLWDLVRPGALWRPQELIAGVGEAALALRHLHTIEPVRVEPVDLEALQQSAGQDAAAALRGAGLEQRERWFTAADELGTGNTTNVLLHGDWAPENVLFGDDHLFVLDAELTDRGWAEHDVARFLLMLLDRSLFVTTDTLGASRRLRRDVTSAFLTGYYGAAPVSPTLRPLLLCEVAQRWTVRHQDVLRGTSRLQRARIQLLCRYFMTVLDEVSDPGWPNSSAAGAQPLAR